MPRNLLPILYSKFTKLFSENYMKLEIKKRTLFPSQYYPIHFE